ncbi:thiolase family protein [Synergistaceae bacterium OttesenSCG-928-I11]|nr:thiolase family protein [Synergistaceae bacterium OttesenSCG-928-I11]
MGKPVILSACRTAGGKFGGQFQKQEATDLGAAVLKEALARSGVDKDDVAEVIMGNGWQAGVGSNPARFAMYKAGLNMTTPAFTINIRCGSGLRTAMLASDKIRLGDANAVLAGGMECASKVPYILPAARWGFRMGEQKAADVLHADGFLDPIVGKLMGEITETGVVREFSITRQEQDEYAYNSHMKAVAAIEKGYFKDEIVPVVIKDRKKGDVAYDTDEIPRKDTTLESLAKLPAIFGKEGGTITAGSSSALCDAGAAMMIADDEWAAAQGFKPMAEIVSYAATSIEAERFPIAPVYSMKQALEKAKLSIDDMELIEINEAFAAQVIACHRMLPFDMAKLNICGGAIALGHPIGASGAKILTTLLYSLKRQGKQLGMASACIGGGQGVALIVKML